jgi:predicted nucleic acid-binding protein
MANKLRRCWDSDCCFGFLANQSGRAEECAKVIEEAEAGRCEILISALAIAEVLHLRGKHDLPKKSRDTIRAFFRRGIFVVADVDRGVAERAQDIFWDFQVLPKDAVHLATALAHNAHYLETYDGVLLGKSRLVGGDPQLVIQHPGKDLQQIASRTSQVATTATLFDRVQ